MGSPKELTSVGEAELSFAFLVEAGIHADALPLYWTLRGPTKLTVLGGGLSDGSETTALCKRIALDLYSGQGKTPLGLVFKLLPTTREGVALVHLVEALQQSAAVRTKYVNWVLAQQFQQEEDGAKWAKAIGWEDRR